MKKFLALSLCLSFLAIISGLPESVFATAVVCPAGEVLKLGGTSMDDCVSATLSGLTPGLYSPQSSPIEVVNVTSTPIPLTSSTGGLTADPTKINTTVNGGALSPTTSTINPDGTVTSGNGDVGQNTSGVTAGCQSSNIGGSLGNIGSQLLGSLVNKLMPGGTAGSVIQSLLSGGGVNATGLINQLAGGSQYGSMINLLLNTGGIGNQINGLVNSGLSSILGSTGLSNILGSGGLSSLLGGAGGVQSLASSMLGGALGTVAGGLGAGAVPVDTVTANPLLTTGNQQTLQIQNDQNTQLEVTCVGNVITRQAANDFAAKHAQTVINDANTGNGGGPRFVQNISQENATLANTVHTYNVNTVLPQLITGSNAQFLQYVQQRVVAEQQAATDPKTMFTCPVPASVNIEACLEKFSQCGTDYASQIQNWTTINSDRRCNPNGLASIAIEYDKTTQASRVDDQKQLIQAGNGILAPITCLDASGNAAVNSNLCVNYKVLTAPAVTTNTITTAVALGAEKQAHANEIGSLVDSLFAQLAQTALTSLTGMIGLSQNQNGQASYLDQVVGNTNATTLAQTQTALQGGIENSIGVEVAYEDVLYSTVGDLQNEEASFSAAAQCYAGLTVSTVASSTPQILADQASTTISSVIVPMIDQKNVQISDSENVLSQLNTYDDQVKSAQTIDDINALSNAYQALVTAGALHTSADVTLAQADRTASKQTLDILLAGLSSAQCRTN